MATSQVRFSDHRRLVLAETNFKSITCGRNILHIAFLARNQIEDIFRLTMLFVVRAIRTVKNWDLKVVFYGLNAE